MNATNGQSYTNSAQYIMIPSLIQKLKLYSDYTYSKDTKYTFSANSCVNFRLGETIFYLTGWKIKFLKWEGQIGHIFKGLGFNLSCYLFGLSSGLYDI